MVLYPSAGRKACATPARRWIVYKWANWASISGGRWPRLPTKNQLRCSFVIVISSQLKVKLLQIAVSGPAALVLGESEGQAMRLPLPDKVVASAGEGRRVMLGIRPENLTRYDRRRTEEKPYLGMIQAPVEVVEPTGAETITIVRIGSREIIARFEPDAAPAVGETVTLAVDMAKVCLFDPETEMLI